MRGLIAVVFMVPAGALAQDVDSDGVQDGVDNCVGFNNPLQEDINADGFGDVCVDPSAMLQPGVSLGLGARVQARATIGASATLGAFTIVSRRASLGDAAVLADDVLVGRSVVVGVDASLHNGVALDYGVTAGDRLTVFDNALVGSLVQLGDDVTIGANAAIARAAVLGNNVQLGPDTVVGPGTQIQDDTSVEANVRIRKDVQLLAGSTVRSGSRIGRGAVIEAGATVGEDVTVGAGATVVTGAVVPDGTVIARQQVFGSVGEVCGDGADNDANGLFDCEEAVCLAHPTCGPEVCTDGVDNDGDGDRDCADTECIAEAQCQITVTHQSNVIDVIEIRGEQYSYIFDNTWGSSGSYSPGGTCANLSSALVTGPLRTPIARAREVQVRGVFGHIQRQVPASSGSYQTTEQCRFDVGNATFTGSGSVLNLTNRTGVVVQPGCGIVGDSFLPTQLTLVVGTPPGSGSGYGSSSYGSSSSAGFSQLGPAVLWDGEPWYMADFQLYDANPNQEQVYGGMDEPIGACGDFLNPIGIENRSVFWGPNCECEGRIVRNETRLRWGFSGATAAVNRQAP